MRRRIPHHITQRGNNKEKTFLDNEDKQFYLESLQRYKDKYKILAYCLMENHVHILAIPEEETSLARGIGGTNLLYTQYINRKYNRSGRLWQNRLFSSLVEEEPFLWAVIKIHRVKSGQGKTCQTGRRRSMVKCKSSYIGHKR